MWRHWVCGVMLLLGGCAFGDQDEAGSTTGPGVNVHCAAATPQGATTTVVRCPGVAP